MGSKEPIAKTKSVSFFSYARDGNRSLVISQQFVLNDLRHVQPDLEKLVPVFVAEASTIAKRIARDAQLLEVSS